MKQKKKKRNHTIQLRNSQKNLCMQNTNPSFLVIFVNNQSQIKTPKAYPIISFFSSQISQKIRAFKNVLPKKYQKQVKITLLALKISINKRGGNW
eukprot:TRINITY_DN26751_c0_g1_i1.p2 TRINITY_DN26751_c0_g1~~TRINITY_DN26751_c0_g1_i1.p2  ORF type:complete len:103 (-),score=7.80 TRINITY_DN26751_c0_g1_i1:79-363(-)